MPVILTSFKRAKLFNGDKFSIARFQPKGYAFENLPFLAAHDKNNQPLLLRNFSDPIPGYEKELREAYNARWEQIDKWLKSLDNAKQIILCCWCPYSQSTIEQKKEFGSFACHSGLIGRMINKHRKDITIIMDEDREDFLIPEWKPEFITSRQEITF